MSFLSDQMLEWVFSCVKIKSLNSRLKNADSWCDTNIEKGLKGGERECSTRNLKSMCLGLLKYGCFEGFLGNEYLFTSLSNTTHC
jgi:hypothetical protein